MSSDTVTHTLTPRRASARLALHGLHVSDDTLRRWARAGRLAALELPSGRLLFAEGDIDALISRSPAAAGAPSPDGPAGS